MKLQNLLRTVAFGALLSIGVANAEEVIIRVAPPRPLVEHRPARPGREFVWVAGYHRWDGARYVWVPGEWRRPERPGAVWVPAHYVRRPGGVVFVEGHWR